MARRIKVQLQQSHYSQVTKTKFFCFNWGLYKNPDREFLPFRKKSSLNYQFSSDYVTGTHKFKSKAASSNSRASKPVEEDNKIDVFLDIVDKEIQKLPLMLSIVLFVDYQIGGKKAHRLKELESKYKDAQIDVGKLSSYKYNEIRNAAICRLTERLFGSL